MAEFDRLFGNMSDADYKIWMGMSKEERQEMARELALDKRQKRDQKKADDMAKDKKFRKDAIKAGAERANAPKQPIYNEDYSLATSPEGLAAKALADEKLKSIEANRVVPTDRGLSNIGGMGPDATGYGIDTGDEPSLLDKSRLMPGLDEATEQINRDNRVITDKDHAEAKALKDARMRAGEFPEIEEELPGLDIRKMRRKGQTLNLPIGGVDPELSKLPGGSKDTPILDLPDVEAEEELDETTFDENGDPITLSAEDAKYLEDTKGATEFSGLSKVDDGSVNLEEQAADARRFEKEYQGAAFPEEPSWTRHLIAGGDKDAMKQINQDLGKGPAGLFTNPVKLKAAAAAFISAKLAPSFLGKEAKNKIIDSIIPPITKKDSEIYKESITPIKEEKKKDVGLINLDKKKVTDEKKKKGEVTGDFVKFDDAGYPIYRKGSKWGKSFNDAYGKSLEDPNNKTFSWTGHDGKSRSYTNDRALKTIKEAPAKTPEPLEELDAQESKALEQSDAQAKENQLLYGGAKTEVERNKVVEKVIEAETTPEKKKEAAGALRENDDKGPDRYFVDPFTGWAMCLTCAERRKDRKDIMELAKTLPADVRAAYYFSKGLIKKADFDLVTKDQNLKDAMARKLTQLKIDETGWKIISAKAEAEKDPKRKEYLKMFLNASSNKNFELIAYLGGKLGLDEGIMETARKAQYKYEMDKLKAKGTGGGLEKGFSKLFAVPYKSVVDNKLKWMNNASAIVQTKGKYASIIDLDGKTKMVDRTGRFKTYGLYEQDKMQTKSLAEKMKIFERSPYRDSILTNVNFHNSKGKFDPNLLINDKDAYEQYLLNDLVWMAMDDAYSEQYGSMMKWITKNSYNFEKEEAKLKKLLTAGASLTGEGDKKRPTSELKL